MAKEIDLTSPAVAPPAKPAQLEQLPGGPLPVGRPIQARSLTAGERAKLENLGWQEGDPVPANFAEIEAAVRAAQQSATDLSGLEPPVPLDTPPLQYDARDIEDLSPEHQAHYQEILRSVLQQSKSFAADREQAAKNDMSGIDKSVLDAIKASSGEPSVVNDIDQDKYDAGQDKKFDDPRKEAPSDEEPETDTERCSRCGWPKDIADPVVPTSTDKDQFLQAVLGQKPFVKSYDLYGGRVRVDIRTLTYKEVDNCWHQTFADYSAGLLKTAIDQNNQLLRYRTSLQVCGITGGLSVNIPKSYEEWVRVLGDKANVDRGATVLPQVFERFSTIVAGESMYRTITGLVEQFNSLVVKMEANANSPDFWTAVDD